MNFYEHHLGDYMRDTAHLSMLEDAAYRRLLDAYYIRERPLPADIKDCFKLIRAVTDEERAAVSYVLQEFFQLQTDGYHQRRCDAEVKRYKDKRAKAKASAAARWADKQSESERNANALPTQSGRIADALPTQTDRTALAMPTHSERIANGMRTHSDGISDRITDAMHSDGFRTSERNANGMLSSLQSPVSISKRESSSEVSSDSESSVAHSPSLARPSPVVETPSQSPEQASLPLRRMPAGYNVERIRAWAAQYAPGVDFDHEVAKLREYTFPRLQEDWEATTRAWLLKAKGFKSTPTEAKQGSSGPPLSASQAREANERDSLRKLIQRRASIGIPDFRMPKPGETVSAYRRAQDAAWHQVQDARAKQSPSAVETVKPEPSEDAA